MAPTDILDDGGGDMFHAPVTTFPVFGPCTPPQFDITQAWIDLSCVRQYDLSTEIQGRAQAVQIVGRL